MKYNFAPACVVILSEAKDLNAGIGLNGFFAALRMTEE